LDINGFEFFWIVGTAGNLNAANVSAEYTGKQVLIGWIYKSVQEYTIADCLFAG
jgi:hypothetical protein